MERQDTMSFEDYAFFLAYGVENDDELIMEEMLQELAMDESYAVADTL